VVVDFLWIACQIEQLALVSTVIDGELVSIVDVGACMNGRGFVTILDDDVITY
jgi:hypothetical protein